MKTDKKDFTKYILYGVVVVLAVAVVYLLVKQNTHASQSDSEESSESRQVVVMNENQAESLIQRLKQESDYVPPGSYTMTMNNTWHFASGDAISEDAYVKNIEENTNDVYFDLFLDSDMENAIYKSPVIPLGASLKNIKLDKPLSEGTYHCILVYHLVDSKQNTISTVSVKVKVVIES